jgi:hypothetical protein
MKTGSVLLERRIRELERTSRTRRRREPDVVLVVGGLSDDAAGLTTAGGHTWHQDPYKPFAAFQDRVTRTATALGEPVIVFDGLENETPPQVAGSSEFDL